MTYNRQNNQQAKAPPDAAERISALLEPVRAEWPTLSTTGKLAFDAERAWFVQSCMKSDYAAKLALQREEDTQAAFRNVAAVGVTLNPAMKRAYVLPRDSKMVYDLSYLGLIHLAIQGGGIVWAHAEVVYEAERRGFRLMGYTEAPRHERDPFATDRGDIIGAYVVVRLPAGDYLTNVMSVEDINAIRDRSSAWKQYVATANTDRPKLCPWNTDYAEMAKKTVVKNAWKYWPGDSEALARAANYLNTEGGQGIDLTPEDESRTRLTIWKDKISACTTGDAINAALRVARQEFADAEDPDGFAVLREHAIAYGGKLAKPAPAKEPAAAPAADPNATRALTAAEKLVAKLAQAPDYADLEALGPEIDALPVEEQWPCNEAYNARLEQIKESKR